MDRPTRATRPVRAPGLALVLLLLAAGPAAAQLPVGPEIDGVDYMAISVNVDDFPMKEVEFLGQVEFQMSLEDLSRDAATESGQGSQGYPHQTIIRTEVLPYVPVGANGTSNATVRPVGWAAGGGTAINTVGGQTVPFVVSVKTSGAVVDTYVRVLVNATTTRLTDGRTVYDDEEVVVKLAPYYAGRILMTEPPLKVGQYETVSYPFEITNFNFYHDAFLFNASAPEGYFVSVPPRVVLQPRETRVVNLTIVTPHDKVFDLGTPGTIIVQMASENEPKVVYTAATTVTVFGPYLPLYWWPLLVLGLAASGVAGREWRERRVLKRGEKGLARRPRPSPREAAFLKELKRRDKEAWKAKQKAYAGLYAARRKLWKERRKEELAVERAERKESRRLAAEQRAKEARLRKARRKLEKAKAKALAKERKEQAKLEARARKAAKKEEARAAKSAKKQGKVDKKQEAKDAKRRKKLEKELAKKRAALEKAAAKKRRELEKAKKKALKGR